MRAASACLAAMVVSCFYGLCTNEAPGTEVQLKIMQSWPFYALETGLRRVSELRLNNKSTQIDCRDFFPDVKGGLKAEYFDAALS